MKLAAALLLLALVVYVLRRLADPEGMNETPVERGVRYYWRAAA